MVTPVAMEPLLGYHPCSIGFLTSRRDPGIIHVIRYFHILFFLLKTHYLSFTSWLTNKSIYNFISTDFLPLSTDSLVIPSNAPAGIGLPALHVGSSTFAASANACLY